MKNVRHFSAFNSLTPTVVCDMSEFQFNELKPRNVCRGCLVKHNKEFRTKYIQDGDK
jgi:hypothetical protein